jgi:hypothetical protein
MSKYIVKYGQSIYDIATEVYGGISGIASIISDNPHVDLETVLSAGDVLEVFPSSNTIFNQNIVKYFEGKIITNSENPSSADTLINFAPQYGELLTENIYGDEYVDTSIWDVDTDGTGLLQLDGASGDRIKMAIPVNFSSDLDSFMINIDYDTADGDMVLIGSSSNDCKLAVEAGKVVLYSNSGIKIVEHTVAITTGVNEICVCINYYLNNDVLTRQVVLQVNAASTNVDTEDVITLDVIGGEDNNESGTFGLKLLAIQLNEVLDTYYFNEQKGRFVFKDSK